MRIVLISIDKIREMNDRVTSDSYWFRNCENGTGSMFSLSRVYISDFYAFNFYVLYIESIDRRENIIHKGISGIIVFVRKEFFHFTFCRWQFVTTYA